MNTLRGKTILVLEDEPIISIELEDMLRSAGADAVMTGSIDEAAEALDTRPIDAAILDINIHGELSFPVAQTLEDRDVPFLFASGYGGAVHPPRFKDVPTVAKPYRLADIEQALAR